MCSPWGWGHLKARGRALWQLLTSPHFVVITSKSDVLRCNFNISHESYQWVSKVVGKSIERHEAEAEIMQEVSQLLKTPTDG